MPDPEAEPSSRPRGGLFDFSRVNPVRSLVIFAIGAVVGIAIAGVGLFEAKKTATFVVPADSVATVNQRPIYRADFDLNLHALYDGRPETPGPAERRMLLDQMIREELYVQRGLELDLASTDSGVRSALVSAVEAQVAFDATSRVPSDKELTAYYEAHRDKYQTEGTMTVVDFLAPDEARAAKAVAALRQGVPAAQAASRFGLRDTGAVKDEEFYFAVKIHLGPELFAAAAALRAGQASDPIKQPNGLHVLYMKAKDPPRPLEFASVRQQVQNNLIAESIVRLSEGNDKFLRRRANVLLAPDFR